MALKYSSGLRNSMIADQPLRNLLTGSVIRIYSGPAPATADAALGSAVLLVEISVNGSGSGVSFESTVSNGTLTKSLSEVWNGTCVETGTASFFRMVQPTDDGLSSTVDPRIQGTVAVSGADMNITQPNLTNGAVQSLEYFYLTMPES